MRGTLEFLLVGRTPLGSAIRGVLITVLLTLFWTLFFFERQRWTLFTVSLITALVVVAAAHLFSTRDNPSRVADTPGPDVDPGL